MLILHKVLEKYHGNWPEKMDNLTKGDITQENDSSF